MSNLTENQLLFWLGYKLQPGVPIETHAIRFVLTIEGDVEPAHFQGAIQKLVDQADALRTVVREVDMVPLRHIAERHQVSVECIRGSGEPDAGRAFRRWVDMKRRTPVSADVPFETALVELAPDRWAWYLALHHVISDARTVLLIAQHVSRYYQLSLEGQLESAASLPSFEEYVAYDRAYRSSDAHRKAATYWARKLDECPREGGRATLVDLGRWGDSETLRTDHVAHELRREQTRALQEVVRREVLISAAVPFLTVCFLTMAWLRRAGGPLTIAAPFLNRPDRFLGTIGLFVTTCPLVVRIHEEDTFLGLARKVQAELIRAASHQNYPVQNPVHRRVYDALFNYLNVQFTGFAGRHVVAERIRSGYSNLSFTLTVRDYDASGRFTLDFEFRRREFAEERQEAAVACVLRQLDAFLSHPGQIVGSFL